MFVHPALSDSKVWNVMMHRPRTTGLCPAVQALPAGGERLMKSEILAPYVTPWTKEQERPFAIIQRGPGIGYADETLGDRDSQGILWTRTPLCPREGRPEFNRVHPARQRRAMRRLLCQVCAGPADHTDDGVLWILKDHRDDWPTWPDGMAVTEPPICIPCARLSAKVCPALRRGAALVRARFYPLVGVRGTLYRGGARPVRVEETTVAFTDPDIRWILAANLPH
jgi:hypothetical protein